MIPPSIDTAEQELRRVIERRQTGDVSKCIAAYADTAKQQLKSLLPGDPARLEIYERVRSVLDWGTVMLQTRRSFLADDLRALQKTHRFLGTLSNR
jgi:hypothetical protein